MISDRVKIFPSHAAALIMLVWAVTFTPLIIARNLRHTMSGRYMLLQATLLAPLAAAGVRILVEWAVLILERFKARPGPARRIMTAVVVVPMAVGMATHAMRPLHEGDAYVRDAGLWLGRSVQRKDYVFGRTWQILTYSQTDGDVLWDPAFESKQRLLGRIAGAKIASHSSKVFAVFSERDLAAVNSESLQWLDDPVFTLVKSIPQDDKGRDIIPGYIWSTASG